MGCNKRGFRPDRLELSLSLPPSSRLACGVLTIDTTEPNASGVFPLLPSLRRGKLRGMENAKRPLPPGLDFLKEIARAKEYPPEELLEWLPKHIEQIRLHADLLRQHGFDPDYMIGLVEPSLKPALAAEAEYQQAMDKCLHAAADEAEAWRKVADSLEQVVAELKETQPFHPDLQELEEKLEALREQYPKLPED